MKLIRLIGLIDWLGVIFMAPAVGFMAAIGGEHTITLKAAIGDWDTSDPES